MILLKLKLLFNLIYNNYLCTLYTLLQHLIPMRLAFWTSTLTILASHISPHTYVCGKTEPIPHTPSPWQKHLPLQYKERSATGKTNKQKTHQQQHKMKPAIPPRMTTTTLAPLFLLPPPRKSAESCHTRSSTSLLYPLQHDTPSH